MVRKIRKPTKRGSVYDVKIRFGKEFNNETIVRTFFDKTIKGVRKQTKDMYPKGKIIKIKKITTILR